MAPRAGAGVFAGGGGDAGGGGGRAGGKLLKYSSRTGMPITLRFDCASWVNGGYKESEQRIYSPFRSLMYVRAREHCKKECVCIGGSKACTRRCEFDVSSIDAFTTSR